MCGIAGVVATAYDTPGREAVVARMLEPLLHRGPEGWATASLSRASFGYCQLGFVDIASSRQPYCTRDGRVMVVFNGELYDHARIRADLTRRRGPIDPGESALVAELYAEHGVAMVEHLSGMFAIACYDRDRDETILVRDRFGKKPLSYLLQGNDLVFASELRALRRYPSTPAEIDPRSLALFLTFNAVPAPASLLRDVQKVPPGSVVTIRAGVAHGYAYWEPRLHSQARSPPPAEELEQALVEAVRRRLQAEAPVGVLLSGGLDSGLVAALAAGLAPAPLASFSLGFPDAPSFDETRHARALAAHIGLEHTVVPLTRGALARETIEVLTRVDEPLADQSLVPTVCLARAARTTVKAALTGDGADELFMGYRIFQAARALDALGALVPRRWIAAALARLGSGASSDRNLAPRHVAALLARTVAAPPEEGYYWAAAAFAPPDWGAILSPDVGRAIEGLDPFAQVRRLVASHPDPTRLERLQLGMICHFLRDSILAKLDRATMLASLEPRSPFLDDRVVDLALRIPAHLKMRGLRTKLPLKRIAARYLPRDIVRREKQGFRAPIAALLRRELRDFVRDTLTAAPVRSRGLLQRAAITRLLDEHLAGKRDHHRQLWALLCLASWLVALDETTTSMPPHACAIVARPAPTEVT